MATPTQIRNAIDAKLANLFTALVARQDTYFAAKGRYWQGIRVLSNTPADGVSGTPDLTVKPTDQTESWADLGLSLPAIEANISVDTYDGPLGKGWTASAEVTLNGKTWRRTANMGPEGRALPWTQVT